MPAKKKSSPPAGPRSDLDTIRDLAAILNDTGLSEIELERGGVRLKVARQVTGGLQAVHAVPAQAVHTSPQPATSHAPASSPAAPTAAEAKVSANAVKSPMVGTAYLAPAPGAPAFIEVGQEVRQGQTLLIIEAMKTMNQIPAPRAGKITAILIENGQPVEYGEPLVVIE
jgi:acetyl-CoA carboxylase biotin carboxyl carrier protein